jgi:hypothetical protein
MDDIFTKYDDIKSRYEEPGAAKNENTALQDLLDYIKDTLFELAKANNNNKNGGNGGGGGSAGVGGVDITAEELLAEQFSMNPPDGYPQEIDIVGVPTTSNGLNWQYFWSMIRLSTRGINRVGPTSFKGVGVV